MVAIAVLARVGASGYKRQHLDRSGRLKPCRLPKVRCQAKRVAWSIGIPGRVELSKYSNIAALAVITVSI